MGVHIGDDFSTGKSRKYSHEDVDFERRDGRYEGFVAGLFGGGALVVAVTFVMGGFASEINALPTCKDARNPLEELVPESNDIVDIRKMVGDGIMLCRTNSDVFKIVNTRDEEVSHNLTVVYQG